MTEREIFESMIISVKMKWIKKQQRSLGQKWSYDFITEAKKEKKKERNERKIDEFRKKKKEDSRIWDFTMPRSLSEIKNRKNIWK